MVKPQALSQSMANADDLRRFCATTPGMNMYQPIAASALEVCTAAASAKTRETDKLAAYIVDRTAVLINGMVNVPSSPGLLRSLEGFEQKLDAIRQHIEQMPVQSRKTANLLLDYKLKRETNRLKAELENHWCELLAMGNTCSPSPRASRSDSILELVSLSTRAAGAICEAPVLNFLKPVVGITALICDTAKCVKSNHDAAADLAKRASAVTKCIVDRLSAIDSPSAADNEDAVEALKLALKDIQAYLAFLRRPRRRLAPWVFANQEKDRFVQLDSALDKALAMFSATEILSTGADVRANSAQIGVLVSTVQRLEFAIIQSHPAKFSEAALAPRSPEGQPAQAKNRITPFLPYLVSSTAHLFFFRLK